MSARERERERERGEGEKERDRQPDKATASQPDRQQFVHRLPCPKEVRFCRGDYVHKTYNRRCYD